MDPVTLDQVQLNFSPAGMAVVNGAIGLMMLGVALELRLGDFKRVLTRPKAPVIGLTAQFLLLPAFTFLLVLAIRPAPSIALGMMLVAACPGGNLSNIMTYLAKGNCAVSISMTALSTIAAVFMTPLNISVWGRLNPSTAPILRAVHLNPVDVFVTVFIILGIPLIVGMGLGRYRPSMADRVRKPFKLFSLVFFVGIACAALAANWQNFVTYVGLVILAVFLQNALAFGIGYGSGRLLGLTEPDCRAVCMEVGIQNSALGLVLVFNFFNGMGGMAILVAWWGIWHIISGLSTAFFFSRIKGQPGKAASG